MSERDQQDNHHGMGQIAPSTQGDSLFSESDTSDFVPKGDSKFQVSSKRIGIVVEFWNKDKNRKTLEKSDSILFQREGSKSFEKLP